MVPAEEAWTPQVLAALPSRHGPHAPPVPTLHPSGSNLRLQVYAVFDETGKDVCPPGKPRAGPPAPNVVMSDHHCSLQAGDVARRKHQPKPWEADHLLYLFGRTPQGHSVLLRTAVDLQLTVELPRSLVADGLHLVGSFMELVETLLFKKDNTGVRRLQWEFGWRCRAIGWVQAEPGDAAEDPKNYSEDLDPREQRRRFPTIRINVKNEYEYRKLLEILTSEGGLRPGGHPVHAPPVRVQVWETRDYVSVQQSALLRSGVVPGAWIDVDGAKPLSDDVGNLTLSLCDLQAAAPLARIRTDTTDQSVGCVTTLSWDAEVVNGNLAQHRRHVQHNLNKFPDANVPSNSVVQIAATFAMADGRELAFLLELAPGCHPGGVTTTDGCGASVAPDVVPPPQERVFQGRSYTTLYFPTERVMLLAFRDLIAHYDPDVIMDFNGKGFDWPYITARMGKVEAEDAGGRFLQLGRLTTHRFGSVRLPYRLSSSGRKIPLAQLPEGARLSDYPHDNFHPSELGALTGSNFAPVCIGRIYLDICEQLRDMGRVDKTLALPNYTLKAVAKKLLRDREKMDFTPANIFAAWHGDLGAEDFLRISDDNEGVDDVTGEPREPAWYAREYPDAPRLSALRAEVRRRRAAYDAAMADFTRLRTLRKALAIKSNELRRASAHKRFRMAPDIAAMRAELAKVRARAPSSLPPPPEPLVGVPPGAMRRLLGDYCVVDTRLPPAIVQRLGLIMFYWQVARITVTPPNRVANGGQMYRVCTMFLKEAWQRDFVVNRAPFAAKRYKGATVLEPKRGYYGGADDTDDPEWALRPLPLDQQVLPEGYDFSGLTPEQLTQFHVDTVVATEDFASLYPNIMRTNNLCPSTKLSAPGEAPNEAEANDALLRHWRARAAREGAVNDALAVAPGTGLAEVGDEGDAQRAALRVFAVRARREAAELRAYDPRLASFSVVERDDDLEPEARLALMEADGVSDGDALAVAREAAAQARAKRLARAEALNVSAARAEMEADAGEGLAACAAAALAPAVNDRRRRLTEEAGQAAAAAEVADEIFGRGGLMDNMLDRYAEEDEDEHNGDDDGVGGDEAGEEDALEKSGLVRGAEDAETYRTIRVVDRDAQGRRDDRLHKYSIFAEGIYTVMLTNLLDERGVYKKLMKHAAACIYALQRLQNMYTAQAPFATPPLTMLEIMREVEALGARLKPVLTDKEARVSVTRAWLEERPDVLVPCLPLLLQQAETWQIICDNRQKALKVCANSIYGVSGAKVHSPCACVELAESVTARGREMIEESKNYVLANFKHYNVDVIYGDTDSVFCKYRAKTPAEAWRIAEEMATAMTEKLFSDYVDPRTGRVFKDTNVMEDESLTWFLALFAKKTYAKTQECEDRNTGVCESHQKGMPTVRRDKSPVLNKLLCRLIDAFKDLGHFRRDVIALLMIRLCCAHFENMVQDRLPLEDYSSYVTIKKLTEGTPHMIAARKEQARSGKPVMPGMAVRYVYVTEPRNVKKQGERAELLEHVLASQVTDAPLEVDRAYYLRKRMDFVRTVLALFVAPEVTERLFSTYAAAMDTAAAAAATNGGGVVSDWMLTESDRDKSDEQLRREAVERVFWRSVRARRLPRGAETVAPLPTGMPAGVRSKQTAKRQRDDGTAFLRSLGLRPFESRAPERPPAKRKSGSKKTATTTGVKRPTTTNAASLGLQALLGAAPP